MQQPSYHYLMMRCHTAFQKQVYDRLSDLPLSSGQPKILDYLYERDGCIQREIAAGCLIEPASVTSLLAKMEQQGYVERRQVKGDRRALRVFLTEQGRSMACRVRQVLEETERQALGDLNEEEKEILNALLQRIGHALHQDTL